MVELLAQHNAIDMDNEFWHQTTKEEYDYLDQTPFTQEMYDLLYKLIYEKVSVKPGSPLFGLTILDCEAVVYLDIENSLLEKHCKKRGTHSFTDALFIRRIRELAKEEKMCYAVAG